MGSGTLITSGPVFGEHPTGTHHNLNPQPGWSNLDAPRVLQSIDGDFTLVVRVRRYAMPQANTSSNTEKPRSYVGGGILIRQDDRSYIRLLCAADGDAADGQGVTFTHAEYFSGGRLVSYMGKRIDDEDAYVAIVRRQNRFTLFYRIEGESEWQAMVLRGETPSLDAKLQAGVAVINSTNKQITHEFDRLSLTRP